MARVTIEDCVNKVKNNFELVLLASIRAKQLTSGRAPTLKKENDKNTVLALREIAQGNLSINELRNDLENVLVNGSLVEKNYTDANDINTQLTEKSLLKILDNNK